MVLYPRIGLNWDRLPKVRLPRVKLPKGKSLSILPQFRTLLGKITQGKITQDKITQGGITQDFFPLGKVTQSRTTSKGISIEELYDENIRTYQFGK